MQVKGIAFDLEGTVIDVEAAHHHSHLQVAREVGVTLNLQQAVAHIPHFIGGPDEAIAYEIWELSNQTLSPQEIFSRDKKYYYAYLETKAIRPRPGFIKFHQAVTSLGLPTAIGSLTPATQAAALIKHPVFAKGVKIILGDHVKNLKPAPDVFLETAESMGISPTNQLVFEDSKNGIKAAISAGSIAIGIPVYYHPETVTALTKAGAFHVYRSWTEIELPSLLTALSNI
jgi:beta-phosphoglucomutase